MGYPKGLLPFKNKPLIIHQIEHFLELGGKQIILVLGHHTQEYYPLLKKYESQVQMTINKNYLLGQFSSVQAGLKEFLKTDLEYTFVTPIDLPAPPAECWISLSAQRGHWAVIPCWQKKGGHPILLSRNFCQQLCSLSPEERLDHQIKALPPDKIKRLEVASPQILRNVNSPQDLDNIDK